ncbi:alpha-ketoglutarate-dependent dioxygenase AlkB [Rothia sp. ZJ1223]|nr:alpha-ketoglutarate-dependent dioxygenase AlkB [Rothia sp. ZJ1223]
MRQFQVYARDGVTCTQPPHYGEEKVGGDDLTRWHWSNYSYSKTTPELGGAVPLPDWLTQLEQKAIADAYSPDFAPSWPQLPGSEVKQWAQQYTPDVALVNYYSPQVSMGMHQEQERSSTPVVSLSIGNSAFFRAGNTENRNQPFTDRFVVSFWGFVSFLAVPVGSCFMEFPRFLAVHYLTPSNGHGLMQGRFNLSTSRCEKPV